MATASRPLGDFPSDSPTDGGAGRHPRNKRDARNQSSATRDARNPRARDRRENHARKNTQRFNDLRTGVAETLRTTTDGATQGAWDLGDIRPQQTIRLLGACNAVSNAVRLDSGPLSAAGAVCNALARSRSRRRYAGPNARSIGTKISNKARHTGNYCVS